MAKYNRIFAALDGGDTQLAVARRALSIAHDNSAEVVLAHAVESTDLELARINLDDFAVKIKGHIEEVLEKQLMRAMHDECVPSVEVWVKAGKINTVLSEMAAEFDPDLVICGVRGLSSVKYAFVGSVSTYLIRHMPCDVLVVHPEAIEDIDEAEYEAAFTDPQASLAVPCENIYGRSRIANLCSKISARGMIFSIGSRREYGF